MLRVGLLSVLSLLTAGGGLAQAQEGARVGQSAPAQLDLQTPATPIAQQIFDLHHLMLVIITLITVFVLALLLIVIVRFNRKSNPKPATWTHNTPLEVMWTVVPVIILVIIAIPSVRLLQAQENFERVEPDLVIKATGYQWYWSYSYPDQGIEFDAYMIGLNKAQMDDEVRESLADKGYSEKRWKLATDNPMVVPVGKTVLMQVTGGDVIHSWAVPSFGVKADSVPGRLNQTWFRVNEVGTYFGQCSELCGAYHSYMPIAVKVVEQPVYDAWVACVQENSADDCPTPATDPQATASGEGAADLAALETR
ncbi:MAG: cytochrome c oxidase subunit II [Pseudomonadota bacterium]